MCRALDFEAETPRLRLPDHGSRSNNRNPNGISNQNTLGLPAVSTRPAIATLGGYYYQPLGFSGHGRRGDDPLSWGRASSRLTLEAAAEACRAAVLLANLIAVVGGDATAQDVRH